jgi:hypothetical protein
MKTTALLFAIALPALVSATAWAQTPAASGPADSPAYDAVHIAGGAVDPTVRDHVVSVYGVGTPSAIDTWWVIFYDPTVASHGRAVKVEGGQIARNYEAQGGVVYDQTLTFPASQVAGDVTALQATQNYAAQHAMGYDHVRALLRITAADQPLRWRMQLLHDGNSRGFVFANATDGTFAMYSPPSTVHTSAKVSTGNGNGVEGDAEHAANEVKKTFLGIGGDLQEFFTGERTVDQ